MKKIALIMDGWKRFFTFAWPAGILQRIRETDEDVNLYIFNSAGDWSRDEEYNIGEYNIYRLPDLSDYDGIIVDLNNIRYPDVREHVVEEIKASGKPAISIANEIEDFYYAGINNYAAMREMIAHLHKEHACKKFWFVMGPEDNYENRERVRALREYLDEQKIPYEDKDFYLESYEYNCGMKGFAKLKETHDDMPDAIMCANDNIAVGVCEAAAKMGYQIPKDFCVTGFDDFDKANYYSPQITTISHIREEVGYQCMEILLRLWNKETVERFNYTGHKCVFRESCGCEEDAVDDQVAHLKEQIVSGIEADSFEEQILSLEYELLRCNSVSEMLQWIPKCITSLNCDAMYLLIDEHMDDFRKQKDYYDRHLIENEEFCVKGYPKKLRVEFAYENGKVLDLQGEMIEALFPRFEAKEAGTDFLFLPLHFRERTVGCLVIRNGVYLMEKQYLFQIVNVLTSAMENLHKKEKLAYMNQVLSELYVKDSMTGLYNRLGYQKLAYRLFSEKQEQKENLSIVFIDMDRLKYINDHFGHIHGDWAIKTISVAIANHCPKQSIAVRNGGDEFLIMMEATEKTVVDDMIQKIRNEIQDMSEKMQFPFPLSISAGCIVTDMESGKTLDDYVREADEIMYEEKLAKNANRK